jgi:outer membrane protein
MIRPGMSFAKTTPSQSWLRSEGSVPKAPNRATTCRSTVREWCSGPCVRASLIWLCIASILAPPAGAQLPFAEKPTGPALWRSYKGATAGPISLHNSNRIYSLMRAGTLYLTVQDAIALAIENNLNLEVQRYALPTAEWSVERNEAGGPIRGLSTGAPQIGISDSGIGVLGALSAAGLGGGNGGGAGSVGGGGGAILQQIGPVVVNFDPSLTGTDEFYHFTQPFANQSGVGVNPLVDSETISTTSIQQGLPNGGVVTFKNYYFKTSENAPGDTLNPALGPYMRIHYSQPLLQNYGVDLNSRSIRVARNGRISARETFRGQLLTLVASMLNIYWNLVSANEELHMRQHALEVTQKFFDDTKTEINLGALPRVELPRAEAEVATRRQDLVIAESTLRQQETTLKEQLVRDQDPAIEAARIVCLDSIDVPAEDNLPPLRELVATAMAKRPDVAVAKITDQNAAINAIGTANGLLPLLFAVGDTLDRGSSGTATGPGVDPSFIGGYGTSLGQIFRRDYPSGYVGLQISGLPIHNRQAQADYGVEQLQLQVSQLTGQRDNNNIAVNVSNQLIALRQARSRYSTAVNTRKLQEQVLADDQKKFTFGTATFSNLIIDQRTLVGAQLTEVTAQGNYARMRVLLDQVVGETLEKNNISLEEGMQGRVARPSAVPAAPAPALTTKSGGR